MNTIKSVVISTVIILSGCAGSPIENLGSEGYLAGGSDKEVASRKAKAFCDAQQKVPVTSNEYRYSYDYKIRFQCHDKETAQKLERQKLEAEMAAEQERKLRISKDYPYEAILNCTNHTFITPLNSCIDISSKNEFVNVFVINGALKDFNNVKGVSALSNPYQFKRQDLLNIEEKDGLHIFLKNSYLIKAHNDNPWNNSHFYTLTLTIKRTDSGEIVETTSTNDIQALKSEKHSRP
jgi:hypothetical protein